MREEADDELTVFLSHSSKDKRIVHSIASHLKDYRVAVFLDEVDMIVGQSLSTRLREAIVSSDYVIVAVSRNSIESSWVAEEIRIAEGLERETGRTIVMPALLDGVTDAEASRLIGDRLYADFRDSGEFHFAITALLRSMARLEPVAIMLDQLEAEISFSPHSVEHIYEGRELLRELTFYREMEVPYYRECILWELCWRTLRGNYPTQALVGIHNDVAYCRLDDPLLGTSVVYSVNVAKATLGVWRLENPGGLIDMTPADHEAPIVRAEQFVTAHGVGQNDGPAIMRSIVGDQQRLTDLIEDFSTRMGDTSPSALECLLSDLHMLTIGTPGRPTNVEIGFVAYVPGANTQGEYPLCAFEGTPSASVCDTSQENIFYLQIEDVFFGSFNGVFLCQEHRDQMWRVDLNLLQNKPSNPVHPLTPTSAAQLSEMLGIR